MKFGIVKINYSHYVVIYGDIVASSAFGKLMSTIVAITGIFGIGFLSTFCLTYISFDEENEKDKKELKDEVKKNQ